MSKSEDVKALFRRFGGNASSYREIVSQDQAGEAEQKWPMLRQIDPANHEEAPSVRRVSLVDSGVRQSQDVPPTSAMPVARVAPEPSEDTPAARLFPYSEAHSEMPALPRAVVVPVASGAAAGPHGGFLSSRSAVAHKPVAEAAPPPPAPAQAKKGWFGRRAAPSPAPAPKAPPVVPVVRAPAPAPTPVSAPARIVAAQSVQSVARRKSIGTGSGRTNGVTQVASAQSQSSGRGLSQVFSSKLVSVQGVFNPADRVDERADVGGLGSMFQRMVTPPAPAAQPTAAAAAARKRAVKW